MFFVANSEDTLYRAKANSSGAGTLDERARAEKFAQWQAKWVCPLLNTLFFLACPLMSSID